MKDKMLSNNKYFTEIDKLIEKLEKKEITLSEFKTKSRELTKEKLRDLTSAEIDKLFARLILRADAWDTVIETGRFD